MSIVSRPRRAANPAAETVTNYAAGRDGTPGKPLVPGQTPVGYEAGMLNPKFWDGMIAWAWFPLLWRNGFRIPPRRWIVVSAISLFSLISCVLWLVQEAVAGTQDPQDRSEGGPNFRDWALALGHDPPARVARA